MKINRRVIAALTNLIVAAHVDVRISTHSHTSNTTVRFCPCAPYEWLPHISWTWLYYQPCIVWGTLRTLTFLRDQTREHHSFLLLLQ